MQTLLFLRVTCKNFQCNCLSLLVTLIGNCMFLFECFKRFETVQSCRTSLRNIHSDLFELYIISWHLVSSGGMGGHLKHFVEESLFYPPRWHSRPIVLIWAWAGKHWSSHLRHLPQSIAGKRFVAPRQLSFAFVISFHLSSLSSSRCTKILSDMALAFPAECLVFWYSCLGI